METHYLTGQLKEKKDPHQVTPTFLKQEFIVFQPGQYPQTIRMVCVNTRVSQLLKVEVGQMIDVAFNIRGQEWHNKDTGESGINQTLQAFEINPANHKG